MVDFAERIEAQMWLSGDCGRSPILSMSCRWRRPIISWKPDIETIFLTTSTGVFLPEFYYSVKEVALLVGDISQFVPEVVETENTGENEKKRRV